MRLLTALRVLLVLIVLSPSAIIAQSPQAVSSASVPRLININGVFRPANGQPAAAVETVTLSIYADQEGGTPLWRETQTIALDGQGRYTLLLGATQADGIPAAVFGSGDAQWLGTVFERAGEVEGPRVRITSVPYALRASDADTLGGRPAADYLLATAAARDGVSTGAAGVDGTPGASSNVVLAGTDNVLAKYTNGGADIGNSAVYEANGSVGINTATPFDALHVRFNSPSGAFTGYAVQNTGLSPTAYSGMLFYDQAGALAQFQGFNNSTHEYRINNIARASPGGAFNGSINFMIGSSPKLVVATNGNVGIGTAAPAQKLHVAGDVAVDGAIISGSGTGGSLSAGQVNAVSQFNIDGARILAAPGTANLIAGAGAGAALTTGQQNAFFGFEAGAANTAATRNSFFGSGAGRVTTGGSNSFFGGSAGVSNTTGASNVFVGTAAGNGNTTGSNNVFVGAFTAHDSVTMADGNVLVGASAGRTNRGSANTYVGSDAGRVATTGSLNAFFGWNTGEAATIGSSNTFIGASAGATNITGGGNTLIGSSTDVAASDLTFATAIGAGSVALDNSTIVLGRSAGQDAVHIWGTLRVGLDGSGALDVCRNANFRLSTCSSSIRYKQQVESYGAGMDVVRRLRPITFTWKSDGARDLGFAAEEVAAIDPLLATYTDEGEVEGVKYRQLTTVLVNAANEQQRLIEQQQKQIDEQRRQIDALLHLVCGQNPAAEFCSESRAARNR